MTGEPMHTSAPRTFKTVPFVEFGSKVSDSMLSAQKLLLESYEESMRTWLGRAQTEASLWSELPARMAASGSVAKALEAYSDCVSQQMQMCVEDGQQLLDDCRRIARKVVNSMGEERATTKYDSELPLCL